VKENELTRRTLLGGIGAAIASYPLLHAEQSAPAGSMAAVPANQTLTIDSGPRVTPLDEIVLVREFEDSARLTLPEAVFATIAGTDHVGFDRMTLRPRVMSPTMDMDLSVELFGDRLFTPILIGPVSGQDRFHADAELGTVKGAAAGKAAVMVSSHSSLPVEQLAAAAKSPLWYQVWPEAEAEAQIQRAVKAGARAVCITLTGAPGARGAATPPDWAAVARLRRGVKVPVLVKGIMNPAEAKLALQHGAQGIIVSRWGTVNKLAPILALPSIVAAIGGKVPVLLDDSVRVGADVVKALALGAKAVLVSRPAMWALAAYGANGVQTMVELLQTELARSMGMMGKSTPGALNRKAVKIHMR
jgi:4-hydroxymandelate oxidase